MMTETVVTVQEAPRNNAANKQQQQDQNQGSLSWLRINLEYYKTIPGIIKLVQLVFGIICMALASPAYYSGTHWFLFVATTSFIATLIWVFVYLLSIREALTLPINWILTELLNTGIITVLYAIAFIVQLAISAESRLSNRGSNIAAGCFGLFNTIAYAAGSYFLYLEHKSSQQGEQRNNT